ncbi:hypothetical protein EJ06DRAFT_527568 [Trichodelitschia bisporula]|uniref:SnoaL-like domain-containing protein n=1 Tax=Trichodelitschia bisporula TaxID=703511 RepID=A0A6G1I6R2_9PEZI|nr:hypothetical protein EJ06DRAFT_527568 [Trichodelitschia bisporula]
MASTSDDPRSKRADLLRTTSHDFCHALLKRTSPSELLSKYFTQNNPRITEHGPEWAKVELPFIGTTFAGVSGENSCATYFEQLNKTLIMSRLKPNAFPGPNGFIVDPEATTGEAGPTGVVCVVGRGTFEARQSEVLWDEKFIYRLSAFDEEGKIGHWEIWADPLSAWDAVVSGI